MPSPTVLFVCTANVCRSPYMQFAFSQAVRGWTRSDGWAVKSRGTEAHSGQPMCEIAGDRVFQLGGWSAVDGHRARRLAAADLEASSLVLVATRQERSVAARMLPTARPWTFTLREARALAGSAATPGKLTWTAARVDDPLRAFAELLNDRRGTVWSQPRRHWARTLVPPRPDGDIDLRDVHGSRRAAHLRTFRRIDVTVAELAEALDRFCAAVPVSDGR